MVLIQLLTVRGSPYFCNIVLMNWQLGSSRYEKACVDSLKTEYKKSTGSNSDGVKMGANRARENMNGSTAEVREDLSQEL